MIAIWIVIAATALCVIGLILALGKSSSQREQAWQRMKGER